jgi:hypothetical protein
MGAVGKISEAIAGGNSAAITAEEAFAGLAQEAVVFVLGAPSGNRVLVETERPGSVAAGSKISAGGQVPTKSSRRQKSRGASKGSVHKECIRTRGGWLGRAR